MFRAFGLAIAIALAGLAGIGSAPAAEIYDWSGFYLGGNIGGSWGRSSNDGFLHSSQTPPGDVWLGSSSAGLDGVLGGLQGGYN